MEARSATPSRLTVYDAPLEMDSITQQMRENLDDEITEVKSENAWTGLRRRQIRGRWNAFPQAPEFRFRHGDRHPVRAR